MEPYTSRYIIDSQTNTIKQEFKNLNLGDRLYYIYDKYTSEGPKEQIDFFSNEYRLQRKFKDLIDNLRGISARCWAPENGEGRLSQSWKMLDDIVKAKDLRSVAQREQVCEAAQAISEVLWHYGYLRQKAQKNPDSRIGREYFELIYKLAEVKREYSRPNLDQKLTDDAAAQLIPQAHKLYDKNSMPSEAQQSFWDLEKIADAEPCYRAKALNQGMPKAAKNSASNRIKRFMQGSVATAALFGLFLNPGCEGTKSYLGCKPSGQTTKTNEQKPTKPAPDLEKKVKEEPKQGVIAFFPATVTNLDTGEVYHLKSGNNKLPCGNYEANLPKQAPVNIPAEREYQGRKFGYDQVLEIPHDGLAPSKSLRFALEPGRKVELWHQVRQVNMPNEREKLKCKNIWTVKASTKYFLNCEKPEEAAPPVVVPPSVTPPTKVAPPTVTPPIIPPKAPPEQVPPPPVFAPPIVPPSGPPEEVPPQARCEQLGEKTVYVSAVDRRIPADFVKDGCYYCDYSNEKTVYDAKIGEALDNVVKGYWQDIKRKLRNEPGIHRTANLGFERIQTAEESDLNTILDAFELPYRKLLKEIQLPKPGSAKHVLKFEGHLFGDDVISYELKAHQKVTNIILRDDRGVYKPFDIEPAGYYSNKQSAALKIDARDWHRLKKEGKATGWIKKNLSPKSGHGFLVLQRPEPYGDEILAYQAGSCEQGLEIIFAAVPTLPTGGEGPVTAPAAPPSSPPGHGNPGHGCGPGSK
jgi:hypothetical protein